MINEMIESFANPAIRHAAFVHMPITLCILGIVLLTAHTGGRLVYEFGIGVPAPAVTPGAAVPAAQPHNEH